MVQLFPALRSTNGNNCTKSALPEVPHHARNGFRILALTHRVDALEYARMPLLRA